MSGPIPEADPNNATRVTSPPGLSARQWQALARLADRYAVLEEGAAGPLGEAAAGAALKASGLWRDHDDLTGLAEVLLKAAEALRAAGLWDAIADGAAPMREVLRRALEPETISHVGPLILELRAELRAVQGLAARLDAWQALLAGPTGAALTASVTRLLEATRDIDVAGLGRDILRLVETLSQTGAVGWLADNIAYLTDTITRLSSAAPAALEAAGPLLDRARDDLLFAHRLAEMGRGLSHILAGPTGTAITAMLADLGRWAGATDTAGLARELTDLLGAWRDAGVFPVLREAGGALADLAASWNRLQNAGDGGDAAAHALFADAARGLDAWRRWRGEQAPAPGGLKGLYRLLTDARVQDGLCEAATLLHALHEGRAQTSPPPRPRGRDGA